MKRRGNWLLGVVVSLALLVALAVPALATVEPVPHSFYGTLTYEVDGSDILAPAEIVAVVEGGGGSITTTIDGEYGSPEPLGAKLVVKGYIERGATIHFYVDTVEATVEANETFPFKSGTNTELDLTFPEIGVTHDLTVASTTGGSVTEPGEPGPFTYSEGKVVDLLAAPEACYEFLNWIGDVGTIADVNAADTTITMNGDYSITANFALIEYQLTVASTTGGSVTEPGEPGPFTYDCGQVVDLLAVPDDYYEFLNWTDDVGTIAGVDVADTTITMNGDYSITANFALIGVTYELMVASTAGGSVTEPGEPGPFTYDAGTVVDLLAVAEGGYEFVNWTDDVGTIAGVDVADTTITMNGDYSITANFALIGVTYELMVASTAGGSVTEPGEPGPFTYGEGTVVPLLAEPDTGYKFVNWTDDVGTIAGVDVADTTITMNGDYSITANFTEVGVTYDLTVASTTGGSVTEPGEPGPFTYDAGEVVDLLAVPDEYYVFINWTGDVGTIADPDAADTNIIMNGDYAITANFAPEVGTLQLCPGWNTMSVPIALHPSIDTWGEFSAGLDVDPSAITYYFDSSIPQWKQVFDDYPLKPCDAIYVKMASEDTATIIASLLPSVPTKQLYAGWNLVGLAYLPMAEDALPGMKANEALISVKEVTGDLTGYVVVVSPSVCQWPWIYVGGDIDDWDGEWPAPDGWMLIGSGYWVFMLNEGTLAGFTFTPLGG